MSQKTVDERIAGCGCLSLVLMIIVTPIAWLVVGPSALIIPVAACAAMVFLIRGVATSSKNLPPDIVNVAKRAEELSDPASPKYSYRGSQWGGPSRPGHSILADTKPIKSTGAEESFYRSQLGRVISSGSSKLIFEYSDANGVVTDRSVTDWVEFSDYIKGYCLTVGDQRTFRKDRILNWVVGEEDLMRP